MECTHSWGGYACDRNTAGLLCYVPRGEQEPRVDLSCERFMYYHDHHGGIIVLVAWTLNGNSDIGAWLKKERDLFQQKVSNEVRPGPEKDEIVAGAMKNYDALIEKVQ